jgi:hypothetical protein
VQSGSTGIDYYNFNVLSQGNKKLATRQNVYVHGSPANNLKDYNALMNDFKDSKAIRVGGATQVIDQRLEISDMPAEAFSTTQTDVGIFMISNNPDRTPKLLSDSNLSPRISSEHRHGENAIRSLLGSTHLPTGFSASQIGAVMKNGKLRDTSPTSLEYNNLETPGSAQSTSTGDRCLEMEPPGLRLICVAGCSQITDKGVQVSPCLSFSFLFSVTLFRLELSVKTVKGRPFQKHQKTSSLSLYFGKSLEAESKSQLCSGAILSKLCRVSQSLCELFLRGIQKAQDCYQGKPHYRSKPL